MMRATLVSVALWTLGTAALAFQPRSPAPRVATRCLRSTPLLLAEAGEPSDDQLSLFASLRARQQELNKDITERWRGAKPATSVPVAFNDWIRRLALEWPLVACGLSRGGIVVADLGTSEIVASCPTAHPGRVEDSKEVADGMRLLFGEYDGGGLLAIAMRGRHVVSAGRDGGAKLWRIDGDELVPQGAVAEGTLVSSLQLQSEDSPLWAAGLDRTVQRFDRPWAEYSSAGSAPSLSIRCGSPVLAIDVSDELRLVACATAAGAVEVFDSESGAPRGVWMPFGFDGITGYTGAAARSVTLMRLAKGWCVIAGAADGQLFRRMLRAEALVPSGADEAASSVFDDALPADPCLPPHGGSCVALTPVGGAGEGLMVSGALDGSLRVWDMEEPLPVGLYGLGGYKVWLGSVESDGQRIVSDGNDNRIHIHDFSREPSQPSEDRSWPPEA